VKLIFDHITGKLTNHDLIYSLALAQFKKKEYSFAFENGWIPLSWYYTKLDKLTWINARNTRLLLNKFTFSKKQRKILRKKDITVEVYNKLDDALFTTISSIYKKYIKHKKFHEKDFEEESEFFKKEDNIDWKYFIYYFQNKPIAFTEIKVFDSKHVLTGQFAWDYENPKLSIGTYATLYEIDWSIKNKCKKYYLAYGYEKSNIYKSRFDGFEFWNGRSWLNDKTLYKKLCEYDTEVNTIEELNAYQKKYFTLNGKTT
jgi:arginyl-tRNA--protein-N-Asp/Glu arginylyltransferase|tara:strand:- start:964 stop:1737 length:774 start_codon:yes stop_codon:yes gene_type:complete